MTQEQILQRVKSDLGQTSVSDRTINDFISIFPVAEGTEPSDAYFDQLKRACSTVNGNISAVASQAVSSARAEWEKPKETKQADTRTEENEELASLKKQLEDLKGQFETRTNNLAESQMRESVKQLSKSLNVSHPNLMEDAIASVEYKKGMSEEEMLDAAKNAYGAKVKRYFGDSAAPYKSAKSQEQTHTEGQKELDDYFNRKFGISN